MDVYPVVLIKADRSPQPAIIWFYLPQGKICFVQEWSEKHAADLLPFSQNLSVTFLIHVPRCTLPQDISLSLFYWYLWCDAVWVRGLWQLTLQSSTWIVCCCAQSNNVFVTHCQTPYTPPFIFLCSIFCTTKQKYVLLSPAGAGKYGDLKSEIFGKSVSHYHRNNWLWVFIHE